MRFFNPVIPEGLIGDLVCQHLVTPSRHTTNILSQSLRPATGEDQSYPSRAYQGKLYMLVDRHTKSMGETVALGFAEHSDIAIIGEQTAGANGDVRRLPLSRGGIMYFSALGAYFLNGELHQMVGVPIDVEVRLSAEDYFAGRDGVIGDVLRHF